MPKISRRSDSTSNILQIFIANSGSTTGAGLTGLTNASTSLVAYFSRDVGTTVAQITLVSMTKGTFTSGGFLEMSSSNMPGWYQFCPPDLAFASPAKSVGIHLKGATSMADLPLEVDLDSQVDVYAWNGTNVSAPATAGIPEVNVKNINNVSASSVTTINANIGDTQPINFTGTGASALVKCDMVDIAGAAVSAGTAQIAVNVINIRGTLSAGTPGYVGLDWQNIRAATTVVALTNTTVGTVSSVTNRVSANVDQIDGASWSTHATGMAPADLRDIAGAAVDTTAAQLGVNLVNIKGTASAGTAGYVGPDWQNVRAATTVVALTNTTISATQQIASVTGNVTGSVGSVVARVTANTDQWAGTTIPAPNITGVPKVDVIDINGLPVSAGTAQIAVNVVSIAGAPALLDANNFLKVDVEDIKGTSSAGTAGYVGIDWQNIRAATTVVSLSNTTISVTQQIASVSGSVGSVTSRVTANTDQWAGTTIPAPNITGVPKVDVVDISGSPVSSSGTAQIAVNVISISGSPALLDANNFLKVDVEDIRGTISSGTAGYVGIDWQNIRAATTVVSLVNTTFGTSQVITTVTAPVTVGTINASASNKKKGVAFNNFEFPMYNSTTGAPQTGLTVSGIISKDSGAFASLSNAVTEVSNGWYTVNLTSSEMNANVIAFEFTAPGATTRDIQFITQP